MSRNRCGGKHNASVRCGRAHSQTGHEVLLREEEHMIDIIGWIVFGLIAGVLARWLMPGKDPGGCIVTVLLGVAGAIVGGFVARVLGLATTTVTLGDRNFLVQLAF